MKELILGESEREGMIPIGRNERKKILGRKNYDQIQQVLMNVDVYMCKRPLLPAFHGYSIYILIHFIFTLFPRKSL